MNLSRVTALDQPLETAIGASPAERQRLYVQVQTKIIDDADAIPVYVAAYHLGASVRLHGLSWATNAKPLFYDAWLSP